MRKTNLICNNLKNTPNWKRYLDKLLAIQGRKRTKAIAVYEIATDEYWMEFKFRLNKNGKGKFTI